MPILMPSLKVEKDVALNCDGAKAATVPAGSTVLLSVERRDKGDFLFAIFNYDRPSDQRLNCQISRLDNLRGTIAFTRLAAR